MGFSLAHRLRTAAKNDDEEEHVLVFSFSEVHDEKGVLTELVSEQRGHHQDLLRRWRRRI